MKNVTITLEEEVIAAARALPEVQRTSLSAFVANLIRREVEGADRNVIAEVLATLESLAPQVKQTWKWNREELYEERLSRYGKESEGGIETKAS